MSGRPSHILVVTGADPTLQIDLTAFRKVRERTGVSFTRIKEGTWNGFTSHLRRLRMQRATPGDVHLAMHMSQSGVQFADKLATPYMLSEVLSGVNILFLAGCESTAIGDRLGIVPYVVTMLEAVDHDSAVAFTEVFWMGVCSDLGPEEAFEEAMDRLPDVGEYAYLHNHTDFLASTPRRRKDTEK